MGGDGQALAVLFQARPPLVDALTTLSGKISTHTDGKAYVRILVSDAIAKGLNRLKLERVVIQGHPVDAPASLAERTDSPLLNLKLGYSVADIMRETNHRLNRKAGRLGRQPGRRILGHVAEVKSAVLRDCGDGFRPQDRLFRGALNEAEALVWQTPYPGLLFPVLAQEKAQAVRDWLARQQDIRRKSLGIWFAE